MRLNQIKPGIPFRVASFDILGMIAWSSIVYILDGEGKIFEYRASPDPLEPGWPPNIEVREVEAAELT